jgi:hypothetical protein
MKNDRQPTDELNSDDSFKIRYLILTVGIFLPLVLSFITLRNFYPVAPWTMMMSGGSLHRGWTYYLVRGETISGEIVDIRPIQLTDGLSGRTWSLVNAAVTNDSFRLRYPHPQNAQVLAATGGFANVPRAMRLPELLTAWGNLYNSKLPASSPLRLKAVRVDVYRWDSGRYKDYDRFIETWRQEL